MNRFISVAWALLGVAALAPAADVADLAKQLKSSEVDQRRQAARGLFEMGAEAKEALPVLVSALKDQDLFVRRFSAQALGEIGPDAAREAVPALKSRLTDPKKEVVEAAATALGKLGSEGITALTDTVKDKKKDVEIRRAGITGLGLAGANAKDAVPVLIEVLKDTSAGPAGKGKKQPADTPNLRVEAATALGDIGPDAKDAVPTLEDLAGGKGKSALKTAAGDALKKITGKGAAKKKKKK
jgi:HEAT repeat protein